MKNNKVYVASSLDKCERIKQIIHVLKSKGLTITYDWTDHGRVFNQENLAEIAILEEKGVKDCDILLMVLPGGGGTHFEFGVAYTLNKPIVILEDEPNIEQKSFYYLPGIQKYECLEEAVYAVMNILSNCNKSCGCGNAQSCRS